ncbi:MAG: hypothetical protein N2314_01885 [Brevinematales bacterium]|nr:hypothetical protein [Brevinematales bacterium]
MKKNYLIFLMCCGVVSSLYGSLLRLGGLGLYHPDMNFRSYGWIVDDPIMIGENGALIYRLSNEIALEPLRAPYSGSWKDASGYAIINHAVFTIGLFVNDQPEPEDYLNIHPGNGLCNPPTFPGGNTPNGYDTLDAKDRQPWFDVTIGSQKIPFSPYLGFSISAAAYSTNYEHIPTPVNPTKAIMYGQEAAFLWKIRAGASIDILKPFIVDASVGVWVPSVTIQTKTTMTEIQNYKNEEKQTSEGNFGIEFKVYPKWKLSPSLEWKNMVSYRYLNLNSIHTVTIDLNGDSDFVDAGELKSKNTHPYSLQIIGVGTGFTYGTKDFLVLGSLNNFTILSSQEWFTVNQSTGSDVYTDKETASQILNYVILNGGAEVYLKKWLTLRMGIANMYHIESLTKTSYTYAGTTETMRDGVTEFVINTMFLSQMGFSLHFGGFSLDWMLSEPFIFNVIAKGGLPYFISGNNSFDSFSATVSIRYTF